MMMPEDFMRCEKCDEAYFKKEEFILIDKSNYDRNPPVYEELKTVMRYACKNCGHVLGEHTPLN